MRIAQGVILVLLVVAMVARQVRAWSVHALEIIRSPAAAPGGGEDEGGGDWKPPETWYGNIQYLANISIIGALCCVLLFIVVKLRSDHRLPGPASLAAKLLAVWHTTGQQIARLCGANSAQYLAVEGYIFLGFLATALLASLLILPLNLYGGTVATQDQFFKSTVIHIGKGSFLLWGHFFFMVAVVGLMHLCIQALEDRLLSTRFHDGESADSVAAFTLMLRGIPRPLAVNKRPLQEYFEHRYPGKIYRVVVPPDLATFTSLEQSLVGKREQLSWLRARVHGRALAREETQFFVDYEGDVNAYVDLAEERGGRFETLRQGWSLCKSSITYFWLLLFTCGGDNEEDRIRKLQVECKDLEGKVMLYREGKATGAGIAFVIFKDVYTASRALQDTRIQPNGSIVSVAELELATRHWKVERAPPARDIYWHHLGSSTFSRIMRRVAVNSFLLLLLFFCSSPLAALTALRSVGHLINPDAMDHAALWFARVQNSSWAAAVILQFLPNVLIFISMYIVIPAVLANLSRFESHLTLSGEHRASLVKTVCFFLVNLIVLRGLLETSLEAALFRMGRCYMEDSDCQDIQQYMSSSFLANSSLSAVAFLITSSFLGISYDLLAPIPWIKRKFHQLRRVDLVDYASDRSAMNYGTIHEESVHEQLLQNGTFSFPDAEPILPYDESLNGFDIHGEDLSVYPLARDVGCCSQAFDYSQYYAFNLTIFAMTLIYSAFVPIIVPIGALYFGYRYMVDKYNFLFVYRVRGFPITNDGKLLGAVLRVMRVCMMLYLLAMAFFFSVRGDREKLQFICTVVLLVLVCAKYGIEKLISPLKDGFDLSIIQNLGSIEEIVDGPTEYERFSRPNFDWDTPGVSQ